MPNQYIPTTPEQNSELQKSKSKFFIIPVVLIALAAIITIGFAASKLFATKDKDSESTTETTTITTTETAATESYSEAVSESTTATTTTTTTTTTIASGENAYDFIDMHKNEDMRLTPWSSENAAIDNENYGEILEEYINNWLDNGESYRIINRPTKEKSKSVLDNNNKIIYNNIETSGAGIKLNNEYYNTVWSNINNNQNYGWLLYDIEDSRGNIEGDINNLNDSNTLELIIDNVKYNITYHKNEKTVGKQFDMIYSDRVEGYLYIRNVQDNIYENNSGYYVIIHLKNNGNVDNVLLYMDQNNNLYPIKYLLTENLDRIKIISKSDENEEYLQTEPYNNNYYNNYSNGYYNNPNNNNSTSQEPIVTNISHESATEPPIANPSNSDNSINESNDNITGD